MNIHIYMIYLLSFLLLISISTFLVVIGRSRILSKQYYRSIYWWIQHHFNPRHRYHIINTGLKPGYYDIDHLMLFGCFSLLCGYVERENPSIMMSLNDVDEVMDISTEEQAIRSEIRRLYIWWKSERPVIVEEVESLWGSGDQANYKLAKEKEELLNELDDNYLYRLIIIRGVLWT